MDCVCKLKRLKTYAVEFVVIFSLVFVFAYTGNCVAAQRVEGVRYELR